MVHFHSVVWIDHRAAHIFGFNWNEADRQIVRHQDAPHMIHHKAGLGDSGHMHEDKTFLEAVAKGLVPASEILIVGPGAAKTELKKYLDTHHPDVAKKVLGVEALDHPTDGELLAFARKFFRAADRSTPQYKGQTGDV